MSYNIIKSIKIEDNKVIIESASNNVYPRTFYKGESVSLTKILQEQGKEALELEIFKAYEEGDFQRGSSKYLRALKILRHLPEYKAFNWRNNGEEYKEARKNRETPAFDELLKKALKMKLSKDKFILTKDYHGTEIYLKKLTSKTAKWTALIDEAKIFTYKEDAETVKTYFTNAEAWQVKERGK